MPKSNSKARVAKVRLGPTTLDGLAWLDKKGGIQYGVAASQLAAQFSLSRPDQAARTIKRALGKGSKLDRIPSELSRNPVSVVTVEQLNQAIVGMALNGHEGARALALTLSGLALRQVFADAFRDRFDAEDRQNYLNDRLGGKEIRRSLTDAIQSYLTRHWKDLSPGARNFMYVNASDLLNRLLLGLTAQQIVAGTGCKKNEVRDQLTSQELRWVSQVEDIAMRLIDQCDVNPVAAISQAHDRAMAPKSPRLMQMLANGPVGKNKA